MSRNVSKTLRQRQTYSPDLCQRVIHQKFKLNNDISLYLDMSPHIVERILQFLYGAIRERLKPQATCTPQFLVGIVEANPDIYLDELQIRLIENHCIMVGRSTLWNLLVNTGFTRKKLYPHESMATAAQRLGHEQLRNPSFTGGCGPVPCQPPHSPDYNPIEEAFAYVKSFLRRHGAEVCTAMDSEDILNVEPWINDALGTITPEKSIGWMRHSGC